MKPRSSNQTNHALTLVEVLLVIVVIIVALLVILLLPALHQAKIKAQLISCNGNLKEIGLSFRVWEGDHGDKYPMQTSVTNGGTMELASGSTAWINFAVMSNELATPKTVICPADKIRFYATNFTTDFNNSKVSYFVSLDASDGQPEMFLSGDENFAIGGVLVKSGLLELSTNMAITWSTARHKFIGNIGLADGSVQQITTTNLQQAIQSNGVATNRLAIP
jgi:competence protein ComGC